jgi:hypothetical protein
MEQIMPSYNNRLKRTYDAKLAFHHTPAARAEDRRRKRRREKQYQERLPGVILKMAETAMSAVRSMKAFSETIRS